MSFFETVGWVLKRLPWPVAALLVAGVFAALMILGFALEIWFIRWAG